MQLIASKRTKKNYILAIIVIHAVFFHCVKQVFKGRA